MPQRKLADLNIFMLVGSDAETENIGRLLSEQGYQVKICQTADELAKGIEEGGDLAVVSKICLIGSMRKPMPFPRWVTGSGSTKSGI